MSKHQGDYDERGHSQARRAIRIAADHLRPFVTNLDQIESCYDGLSIGGKQRVLERTEEITRESADILHDLARLIHDIRTTKGL